MHAGTGDPSLSTAAYSTTSPSSATAPEPKLTPTMVKEELVAGWEIPVIDGVRRLIAAEKSAGEGTSPPPHSAIDAETAIRRKIPALKNTGHVTHDTESLSATMAEKAGSLMTEGNTGVMSRAQLFIGRTVPFSRAMPAVNEMQRFLLLSAATGGTSMTRAEKFVAAGANVPRTIPASASSKKAGIAADALVNASAVELSESDHVVGDCGFAASARTEAVR